MVHLIFIYLLFSFVANKITILKSDGECVSKLKQAHAFALKTLDSNILKRIFVFRKVCHRSGARRFVNILHVNMLATVSRATFTQFGNYLAMDMPDLLANGDTSTIKRHANSHAKTSFHYKLRIFLNEL